MKFLNQRIHLSRYNSTNYTSLVDNILGICCFGEIVTDHEHMF